MINQEFFKMSHGGKREGAGRKSKDEEQKIRELSLNALENIFGSPQAAINHIAQLAKGGSFQHLKLLLQYAYGKPINQEKDNEVNEYRISVVTHSQYETWADKFRNPKGLETKNSDDHIS